MKKIVGFSERHMIFVHFERDRNFAANLLFFWHNIVSVVELEMYLK